MLSFEKTPKGIRIAEIVLGAIAIALSGWVLSNPDTTTLLYVTLLGMALIMIGISRIIAGALHKGISKSFRGINIAIGVISIAGGIFALANPIAAIVTLITIVAIFILIHGLGLIASGITSKNMEKVPRIANIVLGGIAVAFSAVLYGNPGLGAVMMLVLLSLGLLFNGLASIISGITGNKMMTPIADKK
jgi:uncharacterized membrane protein HdeD (DUF308 family)